MVPQSFNEHLPEIDSIETIKPFGGKQIYISEHKYKEESEPNLNYIASKEEVSNAIDTIFKEHKNLNAKLLSYIKHKIFALTGKKTINRIDPEDILFEAIKRILQGNRKWKKNHIPNVAHFILMVTSSLIKHQLKKIKNEVNPLYSEIEDSRVITTKQKTKPRFIPLSKYDDKGNEEDRTAADDKIALEFDQSLFDYDKDGFEDMIGKIETALEEDNDVDAYYVFIERLENNKSNIEIAAKLGITVRDVENALKRIKRRINQII